MTLTSPSSSVISTLPGTAYTDDAVFAAEQEQIFEMLWFCAVRASDLAGPGCFKTVQVGRESVLVTRSRDGQARAFFNVCRHRGARLCTEESGVARRAFQCPYHAWTYDLDGKLIAGPQPHQDARHRPGRVRPDEGRRPRMARLRLGLPGRRAAVVRRRP